MRLYTFLAALLLRAGVELRTTDEEPLLLAPPAEPMPPAIYRLR